jgi:HD superfamily phosphohydrolase
MKSKGTGPNSGNDQWRRLEDKYEFQDEVLGLEYLSELEKDIVDSPEYQRLFRTSQLGYVDLVYQCANHTRGIHSIGVCFWAKKLIRTLNQNSHLYPKSWKQPTIGQAESVLIAAGALLHDISHGPFAHDIEKKTHEIYREGIVDEEHRIKIKSGYGPYEKHDDYASNPILYITLLDPTLSVVARILRHHSPAFWALLQHDAKSHEHLLDFVEAVKTAKWANIETEILPNLLFHLLAFEKVDAALRSHEITVATGFEAHSVRQWGLGPEQYWELLHRLWYQPFRHDIIGDTLSADLLDYLHRDLRRLGMPKGLDLKMLDSYVMVLVSADGILHQEDEPLTKQMSLIPNNPRYRCAIDLNDPKRGTIRMERLNDLFRLLDLRHEIHEKAVFHRVVQSAIAMTSRALLRLPPKSKPTLRQMYGLEPGLSPALCGEDRFLQYLIEGAKKQEEYRGNEELITQSIPQKLAERRLYRPLLVVPGDRVPELLSNLGHQDNKELVLREVAAIVDSEYFKPFFCFISQCIDDFLQHSLDEIQFETLITETESDEEKLEVVLQQRPPKHVIFWAAPYKQLYKDPAILVCVDHHVTTIDRLRSEPSPVNEFVRSRVVAGMNDSESKYAALWKLYVFVSDGLFYTGPLAEILRGACAGNREAHALHLKTAQIYTIRALRSAWDHWCSHHKSRDIDLNGTMGTDQFRALLRRFVHHTEEADFYEEIRSVVAPGDVRHYVHSEDGSGEHVGECRDIRYKYDLRPFQSFDDALEQLSTPEERRPFIKQILASTGRKPESLGREEVFQVITKLSKSPRRLAACFSDEAARQEPSNKKDLVQAMWRQPQGDKDWQPPQQKKE